MLLSAFAKLLVQSSRTEVEARSLCRALLRLHLPPARPRKHFETDWVVIKWDLRIFLGLEI